MVKRTVLWVGVVLGTLFVMLFVTLLLVAFLNLTAFIETETPSSSDLPDLPSGLSIVNVTEDGCGSGSCGLTFDVVGSDGESPETILAALPSGRSDCSARSLIDRRPLCRGFRIEDGVVRGGISLGKWQDY